MSISTETIELNHMQLKDRVYQYLRRAIINGEYEIGTALREVDISTSLGVSKTPVREAFVRLQGDRFVELIPYRGAVVSGYSKRDIKEMYEVREIVEGHCAARLAELADTQVCDDLRRNVDATRAAVEAGQTAAIVELLEKFDDLIYSQSSNQWISDIIDDLEGHQRRIGRPTVEIPGRMDRSVRQHQAIADAVMAHDPVAAEAAMREHVRSVMNDQLTRLADSLE